MAHFKRKKCRKNAMHAIRGSEASWRAKHGLYPIRREHRQIVPWHPYKRMMNGNPAWWDRCFHTPIYRAANKRVERQIMAGADPDDVEMPVWGKPTRYYW